MAIGPGNGISRLFQGGLSQILGRMLGAVRSTERADPVATFWQTRLRDGIEPSSGLVMELNDRMFGRAFPIVGHVPPPEDAYFRAGKQAPQGFGSVGAPAGRASPARHVSRSIEQAIRTDPEFRQRLESALGGRLLPGVTSEGRLQVHPSQQASTAPLDPSAGIQSLVPSVGLAAPGQNAGLPMVDVAARAQGLPTTAPQLGGILGMLQSFEQNVMRLAKDLGGQQSGGGVVKGTDGTPYAVVGSAMANTASGMGLGDSATPFVGSSPIGNGMMNAMAGGQPGGQLSDTMKQQMLQQMMNTLKKFYELLSNLIKQAHTMQMEAINNLK